MITLYNPKTQAFAAYNGGDVTDPLLLQANILIELRAMTAMLADAYAGIIKLSVEQYRVDAVNDAKNPSI